MESGAELGRRDACRLQIEAFEKCDQVAKRDGYDGNAGVITSPPVARIDHRHCLPLSR